jgi:hypothetical protein
LEGVVDPRSVLVDDLRNFVPSLQMILNDGVLVFDHVQFLLQNFILVLEKADVGLELVDFLE